MESITKTIEEPTAGGSVTIIFTPDPGQSDPHRPVSIGNRIVSARKLLGGAIVYRSVATGSEEVMDGRGCVWVDTNNEIVAWDIRKDEWRYVSALPF
jgi:hypothetical protein